MKLIMSDRSIGNVRLTASDVIYVDLSSKKIANCVGCFGCWTKTPGKCVIRDDATEIYPYAIIYYYNQGQLWTKNISFLLRHKK